MRGIWISIRIRSWTPARAASQAVDAVLGLVDAGPQPDQYGARHQPVRRVVGPPAGCVRPRAGLSSTCSWMTGRLGLAGALKVMRKLEPSPSTLANMISPPISRASAWVIESPSPAPPKRREMSPSACRKRSKSLAWASVLMPMPVSSTSSDTCRRPSSAGSMTRAGDDVAPLGELHRIAHEVEHRLADAHRVGLDPHVFAGDLAAKLDALGAGLALQQLGDRLQRLGRPHGLGRQLHLPGLDLGEVEHVVEQLRQHPPGVLGVAHQFASLRRDVFPARADAGPPGRRSSGCGSRG